MHKCAWRSREKFVGNDTPVSRTSATAYGRKQRLPGSIARSCSIYISDRRKRINVASPPFPGRYLCRSRMSVERSGVADSQRNTRDIMQTRDELRIALSELILDTEVLRIVELFYLHRQEEKEGEGEFVRTTYSEL